jgi:FAD/FMN-containing dehydrogenase
MVNLRSSSTMAGTIGDAEVQALAAGVRGEVLRPDDADYDALRQVFNAMIDRHPALIVSCADGGDVVRGVEFARTHGLPLAVRGGGHSVAGNAVCEGGVMLDLSGMKGIRVDPTRRIAVAEPGLTLGEFDRATQAHGLATTLGVVSVTGIAGLTLGGGLGWLNGKYGLACDNLLAAEVVTADGRLLMASATENEDLLWGLRGGGGNFGVVTSFTYRLHPVGVLLAGAVTFPPGRAREALRFYHEFASACPDELSTSGSLGRDGDGRAVFSVAVCYCGSVGEGERVLRPLRSFGPPTADTVGPMDYLALQSGADEAFPHGRRHYWKASFLRELSADAISVLLDGVAEMPSPFSGVGLQQMCGVASRVDPTATAFAHRARQYDFNILSQWADPADTPRNVAWTREFFAAMEPFLERGVYANNLGDEGDDRVRAAYGANYARLAALKATYDPTNLFRLNHNVKPAVGD